MINIKEFFNLIDYTSDLDLFLAKFDQEHPQLSASQRQEKAKFERIYRLRDNPFEPQQKMPFWDSF